MTVERRDRGAADALGLALIAPAAIALALVIVFLGRQVDARATAHSAAEAAAQAAAQERTPEAAASAAAAVAAAMLVDPASCADPEVGVDLSDFGPGGSVAVTITCTATDDGLELVAGPERTAFSTTAFASIDPWRATTGGAP